MKTVQDINKETTYFCARPRLASLLMQKGYDCEVTINPFNKKTAWLFPRSCELNAIVTNYLEQERQNRKNLENNRKHGA